MARNAITDFLSDSNFWLIDVAHIESIASPLFTPIAGFNNISMPEITAEMQDIAVGIGFGHYKVVKGADISNVTLSRGTRFFDSDFWNWMMTAITGDTATPAINFRPGSRNLGDRRRVETCCWFTSSATSLCRLVRFLRRLVVLRRPSRQAQRQRGWRGLLVARRGQRRRDSSRRAPSVKEFRSSPRVRGFWVVASPRATSRAPTSTRLPGRSPSWSWRSPSSRWKKSGLRPKLKR